MQILAKPETEASHFLRQTIIDFILLVLVLNVAIGGYQILSEQQQGFPVAIRVLITFFVAATIVRLGTLTKQQVFDVKIDLMDTQPNQVVLNNAVKNDFVSHFETLIVDGANGFILLCYTRALQTIDLELGEDMGRFAQDHIERRVAQITQDGDLAGYLEQHTIAIFLRDRTNEEITFALRALSTTSPFPSADADPKFELFSFVGGTEVVQAEPYMHALTRANAALVKAQDNSSERFQMWRAKM